MSNARRALWGLSLAVFVVIPAAARWPAPRPEKELDPAAWGSDHVGKPVPEFLPGDQCLFCHRMDVGPTWGTNRHGQTVRPADPKSPALTALRSSEGLKSLAGEVEYLMGGDHRQWFLKRGKSAGRLDLLSVEWAPGGGGKLLATDRPHWDEKRFGDGCAGCHATGVEAKTRAFTAVSLDCFACHGEVPDGHTKDTGLVFFSKKRKEPARVVISVCAQCHIRTGSSRSTGLPYPNNFVAGDNLFRDFRAELSDEAIRKLNPGDAHVLMNVRDVVLLGKEDVTCLSCHDVHQPSGKKHHRVAGGGRCLSCHKPGTKKDRIPYEVHSKVCGY
jgi:hypothetical protein